MVRGTGRVCCRVVSPHGTSTSRDDRRAHLRPHLGGPPGGCAGCALHLPVVGGIVRHLWSVRAWGSGVSGGAYLTREGMDHVPTYPLSRRAAAMGRAQPRRSGSTCWSLAPIASAASSTSSWGDGDRRQPPHPLCRREGPAGGAAPTGAGERGGGPPPGPSPRVTGRMAWGEAVQRGRSGGPLIRDPKCGCTCQDRKGWLSASIGGTPRASTLPSASANVHRTPRAGGQRSRTRRVRSHPLAGEEHRYLLHESMPEDMACRLMPRWLGLTQ
jgi:hypothetical protein